jgi:hypothetical protein
MELFKASNQWSTRPADERFGSLQELYDATKEYRASAGQKQISISDLRVEAFDGDVQLVGRQNAPAKFTHWAFGQLAARVGAPAGYLRELPATLASQNLNHGLAKYADKSDTANLLFHKNGSLLLRAFTSDKYERIWNFEVAERLLHLQTLGWTPAVPTIRTGGNDQPALYASDHDMFAFLNNKSTAIKEPGNPEGLFRGVMVENSEVGAAALKLTKFLFRAICGNFIVWGAQNVVEISVRHVGNARQKWQRYDAEIRRYAESSALADEQKIADAQTVQIGNSKEQVLDKLFRMRSLGLSRKTMDAAYDGAQTAVDGDPRTVWGMVNALTRHSQEQPYADARVVIDRAAGKLMEVNF